MTSTSNMPELTKEHQTLLLNSLKKTVRHTITTGQDKVVKVEELDLLLLSTVKGDQLQVPVFQLSQCTFEDETPSELPPPMYIGTYHKEHGFSATVNPQIEGTSYEVMCRHLHFCLEISFKQPK
ncbi:hypothetical protein [Mangrovibacillus cuniculi]|uniref:Uncharacterized protein n=1 Tax=Mangrovibacillus cuniculi TaxID=2593652 RepID=A0A7S8CDC4_9BACI|nr:hypothetical protein [Mangrovibacillus cuniculi]QPC47817.1 hypothetical protein G8O30_13045 [Mangrovibacillus cuniculi]